MKKRALTHLDEALERRASAAAAREQRRASLGMRGKGGAPGGGNNAAAAAALKVAAAAGGAATPKAVPGENSLARHQRLNRPTARAQLLQQIQRRGSMQKKEQENDS